MRKFLEIFRIDTFRKCSKNIWLSFFGLLLIIMFNYRALVIPIWLIVMIMFVIVCYSVAALIGYAYCLFRQWHNIELETRLLKFFYWTFLCLINLIDVYMLIKVL